MANRKHSKLKTFLESNFTEFSQRDSERLKALYSDFSKLWLLNKYAYDTNIGYWRRVILDCSQQGYLETAEYSLVIDRDTLTEKFQRPIIGKPLSLDCVMETMEKQEELIPLSDFSKKFTPPATWFGWIVDTVVKNTWQRRWKALPESLGHPPIQYVVLPTVKAIAKAILAQHYHNPTDTHIMTLAQFKTAYAHHFVNKISLTESDMTLVLRYLHSQHGVALADNVKGYGTSYMVIKFPQREDEITAITQHDEAVVSIRTTCYALSVQVDALQKKSEELGKQAIEEKKNGHTAKAMYCLKRKKNLQDILKKRLRSMETMDNVLIKIESAQDDFQVVQAFNMGADALRGLLGQDGLSIETVDDVMQKMQDALDDQKEIEDALMMGNNGISGINDDDIERELSQLAYDEHVYSKEPPPVPIQVQLPVKRAPDEASLTSDTGAVNSELSRLNQMFTTVQNVPSSSVSYLSYPNESGKESTGSKQFAS
ncbi:Snf7-domain-containing protein [Parasitella parasitica]|nr:Snf7-domain-containing protein [Parasitella parasitica]